MPDIEETRSFRLLKQNAIEKFIPLTALVELTYSCNLNCQCCYNVKKEGKLLVIEEYDRLFAGLKNEGTFILTFSGGEPLIRTDFFDILDLVRKYGFAFRIFTNGLLLDEPKILLLKKYPLIGIEMSIWGSNPEINDTLMGKPGTFERIICTAKLLKKHEIPLTIKMTVCAQNFSDFTNVKTLVQDIGADFRYSPWLTMRLDGDTANLNHRLNEDQVRKFYEIHDASYVEQNVVYQRKKNLGKSFVNAGTEYMCLAGISTFAIDPFGDIYACVDIPIKAGNIREKSFSDIWLNSSILKALRNYHKSDVHACMNCRLKESCSRCPGIAYVETGELLNSFPYACLWAKVESDTNNT